MKYGEKRDYPKIDIYINGEYHCSTTWARSIKEAVSHAPRKVQGVRMVMITARYADKERNRSCYGF